MSALRTVCLWADALVPRIITEYAACKEEDGVYVPVCSEVALLPGDEPAAMVRMQVFNFLGFALFPKQVGEPISWREYCALRGVTK